LISTETYLSIDGLLVTNDPSLGKSAARVCLRVSILIK